jgi:hypothetical protein
MDSTALDLSEQLVEELNAVDPVDPRSIPVRFSLLKLMAECPAKYWWACQQPQDDSLAARLGALNPGVKSRGEALRFGTAVHQMLLGDEKKIAVYTAGKRVGKAWDKFQADAAERGCVEVLNARENDVARGVVDALKRHPIASRLLLDETIIEQRIDWEWMGRKIRSTPDARSKNHIVDLKTCQSAHPGMFMRQGARLYYHAQAAFYLQAMEAAGEPVPEHCYVVAIEKVKPYVVSCMRFDAESLDIGSRLIRLWFEQVLQCEAANKWPEYVPPPSIVDFSITPREGFAIEIDGERVEV